MIKKFEQFNENIEYNLDKDDYINSDEQKHITELYITQIEKASQAKVIEINGSVSESDCELYFTLSDDIEIIVEYIFHPAGGLLKVSLTGDGLDMKKSIGKANSNNGDYTLGEDDEYNKFDQTEVVYQMVKDMYKEGDLVEINYTHKISLPKELFGNDPYFTYDSDEKTDQMFVSFESEEAAKDWIESLKISKFT
jgi:hypothetical protein